MDILTLSVLRVNGIHLTQFVLPRIEVSRIKFCQYIYTTIRVCNFRCRKPGLVFTNIIEFTALVIKSKEVICIISCELISERVTSKSFHEPSVKSVRIDVIDKFWRATTRELYRIT